MRILHVSPYFAPAFRYGGPPHSILGLCQGLVRAGVDVEVFTTTANGSDPLPAAPEGAAHGGVRVRYFPLAFPKRYWRAAGLDAALRTAVAGADIVHVHGIWNLTGWSGVRAARAGAVPYVVSPRGMLQPAALARHRASKAVAFALAERAHLHGAVFLHATSTDEQRVLEPIGPHVVMIPNGVAPSAALEGDVYRVRHAAGLPDDALVVLFLGRIHPIKRLDLLADAFVRLRAAVPTAHLVIAGPDEGGHRRSVEPLFRQVAGAVHWVGPVDDREKWAWLSACRTLVQCSDSESFGMSVAEAVCSGVPVVVTERGPWQELRQAGCALVAPHTPDAVAVALRRLLDSPDEAVKMGAQGRVWAVGRFGWDEIAQSMIRAYDHALARTAA